LLGFKFLWVNEYTFTPIKHPNKGKKRGEQGTREKRTRNREQGNKEQGNKGTGEQGIRGTGNRGTGE
jgi:hypothetical protein